MSQDFTVTPEFITDQRNCLVQEALSWLNTPYQSRGRVKGAGCDCGTLPLEVFAYFNFIPYVDPGDYAPDHHMHSSEELYLAYIERFCIKVDDAPLPGDLLLYQYGRCISHSAIVVDYPKIIHSWSKIGVILDDAEANQSLKSRYKGCYRLKQWII